MRTHSQLSQVLYSNDARQSCVENLSATLIHLRILPLVRIHQVDLLTSLRWEDNFYFFFVTHIFVSHCK